MNHQIFREYDIRGIADRDLTNEVARAIGRAFATEVRGEKPQTTLVVGQDCRLSSPRITEALIDGLMECGAHVIHGGLVPTPCLYHAIHARQADGGIMVTGSHNPPDMNGFKLCRGTTSIHGDEIQALRRRIVAEDFNWGTGNRKTADILGPYVESLAERIRLARPLKVVLDAGNGAGGPAAAAFMERLGVDLTPLHCEPDGRFPHHPADPTVPENLAELINVVRRTGGDIGIGLDGDADRVGVVDDRGRIIWGDRLLALFAREVLAQERHRGAPIIFEVKCSQALVEDIERHGGQPLMWKTGHSLIKAKMKETGAPLAGEMSGHMFFADEYFGFDDGIYAAGRILRILAAADSPMSALADTVPNYPSTPEIRVDCPDEVKFGVVQEVLNHFRTDHDVIDIDGARIQFEDGWGLVRASNTQPVLVLRFEGRTVERMKEIAREVTGFLSTLTPVDVDSLPI